MATIINNNFSQPAQPPLQQTSALIAVHNDQWSTDICGCFDDLHICCFGFWCFPCFTCTVTSDFGECFCLPLLDMWSFSGPAVSMSMRVAVRSRYGIQGDMMADWMYSTLCNICSWCQIAREMKRRSQNFTVVNSQPILLPGQNIMMASQPGGLIAQPVVISSQAMIRQN
ncbi:placenta-specific gene 8 protein [Esox lucius]|uniref:Uncharacterized protein n=1 Tax=Esox lucius TaxID=8010 RepID=A0A3P9AML0_ESOLU|nr:placenta-specific gene 8 protein [Esox lucius]